ncbi:hypothetical protein [Paenibacillus tianjinensis]|uniref:Uncharacterized protein n=1 Tax=Paenibacillus tianjinensis TaxID=2810347 RepID=A0ABX7L5C3_9BACL|nr:hypothetical protein [Paenibacillus tianjinensis]QSF43257.1 hypothetical protein JRJ22_18495 [Paenibacillus tianjinensis]
MKMPHVHDTLTHKSQIELGILLENIKVNTSDQIAAFKSEIYKNELTNEIYQKLHHDIVNEIKSFQEYFLTLMNDVIFKVDILLEKINNLSFTYGDYLSINAILEDLKENIEIGTDMGLDWLNKLLIKYRTEE